MVMSVARCLVHYVLYLNCSSILVSSYAVVYVLVKLKWSTQINWYVHTLHTWVGVIHLRTRGSGGRINHHVQTCVGLSHSRLHWASGATSRTPFINEGLGSRSKVPHDWSLTCYYEVRLSESWVWQINPLPESHHGEKSYHRGEVQLTDCTLHTM